MSAPVTRPEAADSERTPPSRARRTVTVASAVCAIFALVGIALALSPGAQALPEVPGASEMAPPLVLPGLDGGTLDLSEHLGAPLVVNFGASWCTECEDEAPILAAAWKRWSSQGVGFVGVAVEDPPRWAAAFAERHGLGYPQGLDEDGRMMRRWGVRAVPETFVIDADGAIAAKWIGALTEDVLERLITEATGGETS